MSVLSKMAETALRLDNGKKIFSDEKKFEEHIAKVRYENETEYKLGLRLSCRVKTFDYKGMKCFELKKREKKSRTIILYLHGGAYINRITPFHWWFLDNLAKHTGATVVVPMYPLAPVHTAREAYSLLLPLYDEIRRLYILGKTVLMGDSAGGGLTLGLAESIRDRGMRQPDDIVLISPWLDITMTNTEMEAFEKDDPMLAIEGLARAGKMWAGETELTDYTVSPIYGDLKSLAPIHAFVGTREIFLPEVRRLKVKAAKEGARMEYFEYDEVNHCFPLMPVPEGKQARKIIYSVVMSR